MKNLKADTIIYCYYKNYMNFEQLTNNLYKIFRSKKRSLLYFDKNKLRIENEVIKSNKRIEEMKRLATYC